MILSGAPFRINKKTCTVRFMFHNQEDIAWFKPVELRTKYGRRGHITEHLGTHGHYKVCTWTYPSIPGIHGPGLMGLFRLNLINIWQVWIRLLWICTKEFFQNGITKLSQHSKVDYSYKRRKEFVLCIFFDWNFLEICLGKIVLYRTLTERTHQIRTIVSLKLHLEWPTRSMNKLPKNFWFG